MGILERLEKRLLSAGYDPKIKAVVNGAYADDINPDHTQRAPAIIVHFEAIDYETDPQDPHNKQNAYRRFTGLIVELRKILNKSRSTTYEERIQFYPGIYTAIIVTKADRERLDAAQEEQEVFMPIYEKIMHETNGDFAKAARAGREAVEAWKKEKEEKTA